MNLRGCEHGRNEDLVCGTSLVELEHASEVPFADRAVSSSDDSIDGLRDSIARDVSSGPFSSTGHRTFSSPFEAPLGSTPNSPSSARFMEVPARLLRSDCIEPGP